MMKSPFFKFFSSLKLAVISILTLATVLAYGTVSESLFGTRAAHVLVYGTWWFMGVLCLLGFNVICAALSRYPWKPRQYGFVITHLGIITILFGAFLTQRFGVDGQLPVLEGNQDNEVILNDLELSVTDEDSVTSYTFPVIETARMESGNLMEVSFAPDRKLVVDKFIPRAVQQSNILKSPAPGVGAPALHVELFNGRFRVDEWMLINHPEKPVELNMGPATLSFRQLWSKAEEAAFEKPEEKAAPAKGAAEKSKGYLVLDLKGKQFRAGLDDAGKDWKPLMGSNFEYKILRYLPYAIVQNNELVNKSNDPVNPAVQLLIRNPEKLEEMHTVFANFPEFTTMHRKNLKPGQQEFGFKLRFVTAPAEKAGEDRQKLAFVGQGRGQLQLAQTPDHSGLLYKVLGADGKLKNQGRVKVGEELATGWMDIKFRVLDWFDSAVQDDTPRAVDYISGEGEMNFQTGLHVVPVERRVPAANQDTRGAWILEGGSKILTLGGHNISVRYGKTRLTLPFTLFLEKFHMGTDPGTTKAATYESRVHVEDPMATGKDKPSYLISMNEPLVYGGYTFYQASYVMEEGRPPVSVFSVNYDPGRVVKYAGAIIMVLGIILMFYLNPHYWDKMLGQRKKEVKA